MKLKAALVIIILLFQSGIIGQTIQVSFAHRNKSVDLTNQAISKIEEKKFTEAVALLSKAIHFDSSYQNPYLQFYTVCMLQKEHTDTAIFYLKKAKRIFLENDEICFYLGEAFRIKKNLNKAIKEYTLAIQYSKINGEDFHLVPYYYFNRGNSYLKLKLTDKAILDYNYTLKLNPKFSSALVNRGICFLMKKKTKEACDDWSKAIEMGSMPARQYSAKYCKKFQN